MYKCICNGPSHLAPNLKMPEHQVPNPKSLDTQGMRERVCTMPAFDVGFMSSPQAGRDGRREASDAVALAAAAAFLMINESLVAFSVVTHHGKQLRLRRAP